MHCDRVSQPLTAGIGKRIARYRKINGWSAQRLADNTDGAISRASLASIESGRRVNLQLGQFLAICLALRIPPVALLIDLEQPFAPMELHFPGAAPRPLDERAPNAALADWLNETPSTPVTPAARRVIDINALVEDYRSARDACHAHDALHRIQPDTDADPQHQLQRRLRDAEHALLQAGIPLP